MVLGTCSSSPPVCVQTGEHPTLRNNPLHEQPKDLLTCGVVRTSCSWGAPTLPIRKIPPLAEAATLQSLKHCNANLTWKCISTRLRNTQGPPSHHHELHRKLAALQEGLLSLTVHQEGIQKPGRKRVCHCFPVSHLVQLWILINGKRKYEIWLNNSFLVWLLDCASL